MRPVSTDDRRLLVCGYASRSARCTLAAAHCQHFEMALASPTCIQVWASDAYAKTYLNAGPDYIGGSSSLPKRVYSLPTT